MEFLETANLFRRNYSETTGTKILSVIHRECENLDGVELSVAVHLLHR